MRYIQGILPFSGSYQQNNIIHRVKVEDKYLLPLNSKKERKRKKESYKFKTKNHGKVQT